MSEPIVIASGGVNPSNRVKGGFPNLAMSRVEGLYDDQTPEVQASLDHRDLVCAAELEAAGIDVVGMEVMRRINGEVPTKFMGEIKVGWGFKRAWYYWIATGPGIPPNYATTLHALHGKECRVMGHCGAPHPVEYMHGFGVGLYHVDTPSGLSALAHTIKQIWGANQ